jgi:histidinol-phosphate phosphatase family protein
MRAIFLDRDGVICENRTDHVKSWQEFKFLPEVKETLARLSRLGWPIIVITNQAAIGRGLVTTEMVEIIHQNMLAEVAAQGGRIDRIFYCPHRPEDDCDCRKPKAGMLLQAAAELNLDLTGSYLIGDAASDMQAGQQVGCRNILVLTGRGKEQLLAAVRSPGGYFLTICETLTEAVSYILKMEPSVIDEAEALNSSPISSFSVNQYKQF